MSDQQKFRLLLAEDEPTQRMMLERQLKNAGYLVETANDGAEALQKILDGEFQILSPTGTCPAWTAVRCASACARRSSGLHLHAAAHQPWLDRGRRRRPASRCGRLRAQAAESRRSCSRA